MIKKIRRGTRFMYDNPRRAVKIAKRWLNVQGRRLNQHYYSQTGLSDSYDIIKEDWDTAIILDACRYDYFLKRSRLDEGTLRKETAPGGESREFMRRMFMGRNLHDTIYVTGNPYTTILDSDTFFKVYLDETWNSDGDVATPEQVTRTALKAHKNHLDKRVIVHYMQPHMPILHPDKQYLNSRMEGWRKQYFRNGATFDEIREGYAANLDYVLSHVEDLVDQIDGKVVVTADHGELLGERLFPIPVVGTDHHPHLYVPELIEVPWLEINAGPRRHISADSPEETLDVEEEDREDQLRALGYLS